jgi:FlaA1/EpsC-like NDP-sugar epimerase
MFSRDLIIRLRRPIVVALHLVLIPVVYYAAFALRFDFDIPESSARIFWATLPYVLVSRIVAFAAFGLFRGWWRYVGMTDLVNLFKAISVSSAALMLALFMTQDFSGFPRSVLLLDWGIGLLVFGGIRFITRAVREERLLPLRSRRGQRGRRTLIIGAGNAAERLIRQLQGSHDGDIRPVGLVDDDPEKLGMRLHGVPVLGTTDDLPRLVTKGGVDFLVIAIPSAGRDEMRRIVDACLAAGTEFKIVPSLRELLDGHARVGQLRNVQIEDLLGRDAIDFAGDDTRLDLHGQTVLVTGAAGSIGSELARQVAAHGPARLLLLDQAESPLYFMHLETTRAHPELNVVPLVADVTDETRMDQVFAHYRPEYVFHAAAYKHVPLMETNVVEAVRNNVMGTLRVAQAAARHRAAKFVLISTDKAVYPSSVMGATKRIAERIVLGWPALRNSNTDFRAVRFGNVLGSDGSVVPLFKRQLAAGLPITVTHRDCTRYFMTIPEAVQLVLRAAALPDAARRICMLEMGEPVRIVELAENLVRLSGLEPYTEVPIVFTGLRPGEKLHEVLMSDAEETVPTPVSKVRIVQGTEEERDELTSGLDRLAAAAAVGARGDILDALRALVPECVAPLREDTLEAIEIDR